jgi:hypothetical protein
MMAMLLLFLGIYLYETKKSLPLPPFSSSSSSSVRKDKAPLSSVAGGGGEEGAEKIRRNAGTR